MWPKAITEWQEGRTGYLSVPFTWLLPEAQARISQTDMFIDRWIVGGPAVKLMPDYLTGCDIQDHYPGILQKINRNATRTTLGCPNKCPFCGVRKIEGEFLEIEDFPPGNILCDNNILAASTPHLNKVAAMLQQFDSCDFNQGVDARLITPTIAKWFTTLPKPIIRLACDDDSEKEPWADALATLLHAGVPKSRIRSYVLVAFNAKPEQDWSRCEFVESFGIKALPMWFHPLNALQRNTVTPIQYQLGWTDQKRKQLMRWYYKHSGTKPTTQKDN